MTHKRLVLYCVALISLFSAGMLYAQLKAPDRYFLMSFPKTQIQYPILIYQKEPDDSWKQIAYVPDATHKVFIRRPTQQPIDLKIRSVALNSDQTEVVKWLSGCQLTLDPGGYVKFGKCQVSMNTADKKHGANYSKIVFSPQPLQPIKRKDSYPKFYHIPNYKTGRTITVYNNTQYPVIQVSYWENDQLKHHKLIQKNQPAIYHFSKLKSRNKKTNATLVVTGYGTSPGCETTDKSCWVNTGGHSKKNRMLKNLHGTKIKATLHAVHQNAHKLKTLKETKIKLSAVDGFNFKTIIYPTTKEHCTRVPPSQWYAHQNLVSYVSLNEPKNPLAELPRQKNGNYPDLINICKQISQGPLVHGKSHQADLLIYNRQKQPLACMSPCQYAQSQQSQENFLSTFGENAVDQFCCAKGGPHDSKKMCDAPGIINNSSYVRMLDGVNPDGKTVNLNNALFKNTHSYRFDDPNNNMHCPGETSYAVHIFTSQTAPPMPYLLPPSAVRVTNLSNISATIKWVPASDGTTEDQSLINHTVSILQNNKLISQQPLCSGPGISSCVVSNLKPKTTYQVKVTAKSQGISASSKVYNFKTLAGVKHPDWGCIQMGPPVAITIQTYPGGAMVSWGIQASTMKITYRPLTGVNRATKHITVQATTSAQLSNLFPNTTYTLSMASYMKYGCGPNLRFCCGWSQKSPWKTFKTRRSVVKAGAVTVTPAAPSTANVSWKAASEAYTGATFTYKVSSNPTGPVITMGTGRTATLKNLKPKTTYTVTVTAKDKFGGSASKTSPAFTTPASKVTAGAVTVKPVSGSPSKATVTWGKATDSYPALTAGIRYAVTSTKGSVTSVSQTNRTATVTGLPAKESYKVTVTAKDAKGSHDSKTASPTSPASVVTAKPVTVTPDAQNPSKAIVTWGKATDSYPALTAGITYTVNSTAGQVSPSSGISQTNRRATITGLTSGESYTVRVTATDAKGRSASKTGSPAGGKSPVSIVTAKAVTVTPDAQNPSKATVTWGKATDSYPALTAGITYTVNSTAGQVSPSSGISQTNRRATITGLTPGKSYTVRVTATDAKGRSAFKTGSPVGGKSPISIVTAKAVTVTPDAQNPSKATVTWGKATDSYPALTAGITYAVTSTKGRVTSVSQTNRRATITGLTSGESYTVRVTATDAKGRSAFKTASPTSPVSVVTAKAVIVTPNAQNPSKATVTWGKATDSYPALTAGITYAVTSTKGRVTSVSQTNRRATITGLTSGESYTVRVTATDAKGRSAFKTASPTSPVSVVTAKAVTVTPDAQNPSKATVTWGKATGSYPALTAGIIYAVNSTAGQASPSSGISQTNRRATITGLTSGESYTVRVTATDAKGRSAFKTASPTSPVSVVTAKAVTVTPDAQNPSKAKVTWGKATDSYPALTAGIRYAVTSTKGRVTSVSQTNRTATVTGLPAKESYKVTVTAKDAKGSSAFKTASPTSPASVVTAKAVTVTPDAQNPSKAKVTWGKATDSYPALTAGITYAVTSSKGRVISVSQTKRTATVTGLPAKESYKVTVTAKDAKGSSASKTGSPVGGKSPVSIVTAGAVNKATDVTTHSANITWAKATDTYPGAKITYKVSVSPSAVVKVTGRSAALSNMQAGTKYTVTVTATDQFNQTATAPAVTFTTTKPTLGKPGTPMATPTQTRVSLKWQAASESPTVKDAGIKYTVTLSSTDPKANVPKPKKTSATRTTFSGLTPSATYEVVVSATDKYTQKTTAPTGTFTTTKPTLGKPGTPMATPTQTRVSLSWQAASETPTVKDAGIKYTVTLSSTDPKANVPKPKTTSATKTTFSGLSRGATYQVVVSATDKYHQTAMATSSFTTAKPPVGLKFRGTCTPNPTTLTLKAGTTTQVGYSCTTLGNSKYQLTFKTPIPTPSGLTVMPSAGFEPNLYPVTVKAGQTTGTFSVKIDTLYLGEGPHFSVPKQTPLTIIVP